MIKKLWISGLLLLVSGDLLAANWSDYMKIEPFSAECLDRNEISKTEKAIIEKSALDIIKNIKNKEADQLWQKSHPVLKNQVSLVQSKPSVLQASAQLNDITHATILDERLIKITGVETASTTIFCGSVNANDPSHLKVQALVGNTDIAIIQIQISSEPFNQLVSLQLAKNNNEYRLLRFDINSNTYHGKNGIYYHDLSRRYIHQDKYVEAYIYAQAALFLNNTSSFLQSWQTEQISNDLKKVWVNQKLKNALNIWQIGKNQYQIISIGLISTQNDLSVYVKFIAKNGLQKEQVQQDAEQMMAYMKEKYPNLRQEFRSVLFEASETLPVDKSTIYPVYRVPLYF